MSPKSGKATALHHDPATPRAVRPLLKTDGDPELLPRERRKTFQIGESSTQNVAPTWNATLTASNHPSVQDHGNRSFQRTKHNRRSLPLQSGRRENDLNTKPSILVMPADAPPLRRSLTDPLDWRQGALQRVDQDPGNAGRNNPKRLSINSSLRNRQSLNSPLAPVAEGMPSEANVSRLWVPSPPPEVVRIGPNGGLFPRIHNKGSQPMVHEKGWNARRERERNKLEQAVTEARIRRESNGRGIHMGSSSVLPSVSPLPLGSPKEIGVGKRASQLHLLHTSRTTSNEHTPGMHNETDGTGRRLRHASLGDYPLADANPDGVRRIRSAAPDLSLANLPIPPLVPPLPLLSGPIGSSSKGPPARYSRPRAHSSSSLKPSPVSTTCSSSVHSNVSNRTRPSSGSATSRAALVRRTSDHQDHSDMANGRVEIFPPLMNAISQTGHGTPVSQASIPGLRNKRASNASQTSRRSSSHCQMHSQPSLAQSYALSNASTLIYRENPDKRGLVSPIPEDVRLQREKEKLVRWKAEREKIEFEKKERRAEIDKRVKRANELEAEKEKELMKSAEQKRSWFCGFFG